MYRTILSIAYPVVFAIVFPVQLLLYYIIRRHSPRYLRRMKKVLEINCIMQTYSLVTCCFLQTRQVSNLDPIEIWCYGPLRHQPAHILYSFYFGAQSATLTSVLLVFLTIYLKYEAVKNLTEARSRKYEIITILLSLVLLVTAAEISLILSESLPPEAQEKFRILNKDTTDHSVIGYITLKTPESLLIFSIVSGSVILLSPIGLIIRWRIMTTVGASLGRISSHRKMNTQSFINGLTLQAVLPFICFLPIFFCLFYLIKTKSELLIEQYGIGILTLIPALLDPFITLYSVTPYRKKVAVWLRLEKSNEQNVQVTAMAESHLPPMNS